MGLNIELQDERGNSLASVADAQNWLKRLLPSNDDDSHPMLAAIDPYGDTTFNRIQMKRFLAEWTEISTRASGPRERALVSAVEAFGCRCRDEAHLYLKFIGD
jgi:hypothetical protein